MFSRRSEKRDFVQKLRKEGILESFSVSASTRLRLRLVASSVRSPACYCFSWYDSIFLLRKWTTQNYSHFINHELLHFLLRKHSKCIPISYRSMNALGRAHSHVNLWVNFGPGPLRLRLSFDEMPEKWIFFLNTVDHIMCARLLNQMLCYIQFQGGILLTQKVLNENVIKVLMHSGSVQSR